MTTGSFNPRTVGDGPSFAMTRKARNWFICAECGSGNLTIQITKELSQAGLVCNKCGNRVACEVRQNDDDS